MRIVPATDDFRQLNKKLEDVNGQIYGLNKKIGSITPSRAIGRVLVVEIFPLGITLILGLVFIGPQLGLSIVTLSSAAFTAALTGILLILNIEDVSLQAKLNEVRLLYGQTAELEEEGFALALRNAVSGRQGTPTSLLDPEIRTAYERIYSWHVSEGPQAIWKRDRSPDFGKYAILLGQLPPPEQASPEDAAFVARQIMRGLMEWSYAERDEFGKTMSDYAKQILGTLEQRGVDANHSRLARILNVNK